MGPVPMQHTDESDEKPTSAADSCWTDALTLVNACAQ